LYTKAPPSELEGPIQVSQEEAEEYAFAPVMVALRAMEQARPVLTMSMDKQAWSKSSGGLRTFQWTLLSLSFFVQGVMSM